MRVSSMHRASNLFFRRFGLGWFVLVILCGGEAGRLSGAEEDPEGIAFYEQRIRPLLLEHCGTCHSADIRDPKGGLRVSSREWLLKGGDSGPAIRPGKPGESLLVAAVKHQGRVMPPKGPPLAESQIADLVAWIERGAPAPAGPPPAGVPGGFDFVTARQLWSLRPLVSPARPAVTQVAWPRETLDLFVLAKLEGAGLGPSPEADRRTLLRRVTWDLTGLPPTMAEMTDFLADPSPDAYERAVDRLLASPRYGERWGRHWLDVARFADTKDGVLMYGDNRIRPYAYTYRDYVVRAFNEDLPYDRFIHEQLAADRIVPPVEPWRLGALGFLTLGRMFDNNVHDVIDDRIDTVTRGLLGLTVACARCHDHKYDAISMADYYALYGVFASCEVPLDLPLIADPRDIPGAPEFEADLAAKQKGVQEFLEAQYNLLLEAARQRVGDYLVKVATTPPDPLETAIFFLSLAPEDLRPPVVARWRRYVESRSRPEDPVFGLWNELLALSEAELQAVGTTEQVLDRWQSKPAGCGAGEVNPRVLVALRAQPPRSRAEVAVRYGELLKSVYAESKSALPQDGTQTTDAAAGQLLEIVVSRDSPGWFPRNQTRRYMSRMETDSFGGKVNELDVVAVKSPAAPPRAMVLVDAPELHDPRIFLRGNPARPGPPVERRFLSVLSPAEPVPFPHGSGRLDLAHAITDAQNPLTRRVIVNRVWMHHFGEPLAGSPGDFGVRSVPPVHGELLDFLAAQLIEGGWSLKTLHRQLVLSATYRQTSSDRPDCRRVDAENHLLWRMNRRRLDLESMRDTLLAVSGRLNNHSGGRPVDAAGNPVEARRTIYGLVDRQNVPGLYRAFDFASPDTSAERRPQTTVPQQALFGLNGPFVFEQCRSLMRRVDVLAGESAAERVTALFREVLQREPAVDELADALEFVTSAAGPEAASQQSGGEMPLSRWEQLAQVLLMSNELMFVD